MLDWLAALASLTCVSPPERAACPSANVSTRICIVCIVWIIGAIWREVSPAALTRAFAQAGVPLSVAALEGEGLRPLYAADYALVRPDQIVAWRGDAPADPAGLVARLRGAGPARGEEDNDQVPENRAQPQRRKTS